MSKKELTAKQKRFIDAFKKTFGNIKESSAAADIHRQTYYDWLKNSPLFKAEIEGVQPEDDFLDFLENKAVQRIEEGSDSVLIFALKAKGKSRGWIEKQIIQDERESREDKTDYSQLSDDELRQLIELRRKLVRGRAEGNGSSSSDA